MIVAGFGIMVVVSLLVLVMAAAALVGAYDGRVVEAQNDVLEAEEALVMARAFGSEPERAACAAALAEARGNLDRVRRLGPWRREPDGT